MNTTINNTDFWTTFNKYKIPIIKSFKYIYKNCPDKEGIYNAFNNLLVSLYELNVFNKFDTNKSSFSEKKFEQFLFTWIYKILHESYSSSKKYSSRFKLTTVDTIPSIEDPCLDKKLSSENINHEDRRGRIYPPHLQDILLNHSIYSQEENLNYKQTLQIILNTLKKPLEKKILLLLNKGYSRKEISSILCVSQQYISSVIKNIQIKISNLKKKGVL